MFNDKEKIKKIYDETATVIADLAFRREITDEEMYFLLNMLEAIIDNRNLSALTEVLLEWIKKEDKNELNEEIKKELFKINFKDEDSVNEVTHNIKKLLE
ncbi:hypothetical protein [Thermosyntropha sp.]|uniref:hypothetical protein n=1 Tax=Thermosyntropha sp. TaxID=2740820 RepID=UPI0025D0B0B3|nr:hypothetical protein [Thermosyntropha sp.]MBO8158472.1 hypothetical protein [Thermosyntropha sp.]